LFGREFYEVGMRERVVANLFARGEKPFPVIEPLEVVRDEKERASQLPLVHFRNRQLQLRRETVIKGERQGGFVSVPGNDSQRLAILPAGAPGQKQQ